jgi:cell wall-associated NlpC family hydrolase
MIDASKYIRIPYLDKGRSFEGCDCFGLVILIYRNEFNRELADVMYATAEDRETIAKLIDVNAPTIDAQPVREPEEGDLVLMRNAGAASHIGIYLEGGLCLHTSRKYGTCCERIDGPRLKWRIAGYYRVA